MVASALPLKRMINRRPRRINRGAPGGWEISSLYAQGMNSPQSQKLTVASRVRINTVLAIAQTIQPEIVLTFLKFMRKITKLIPGGKKPVALHLMPTTKN